MNLILVKTNLTTGCTFEWDGRKYQILQHTPGEKHGVLRCAECFKNSGRVKKSKLVRVKYRNLDDSQVQLYEITS